MGVKSKRGNGLKPYIAAILFGALGGLALWHWGVPNADQMKAKVRMAERAGLSTLPEGELGDAASLASGYASAILEGRCGDVIAMTWWMEERLRHVRMTTSNAQDVEDAMEDLCARTIKRTPEGNRLGPEGIEEQYVFRPGASFQVIGADEGRDDLEKPVLHRTWIEVTYSTEVQALRDRSGNAIKSLIVGVNVSKDGYVLKAGVIGNLDIDLDSLLYKWTT